MDKFRLYIGLVRGGVWYNYTRCEEIKGGTLAILDGADKSGAARLLNLLKGAIKYLYSEDNQEYELKDKDYFDIKWEDAHKVSLEVMKQFTGQEKPVFDEWFLCPHCSRGGNNRFTKVNEAWQDLIDQGIIDEHFLDTEDCTWKTILPHGIEIEGQGNFTGGVFTEIIREPIGIGQMIAISKLPEADVNEAAVICYLWDAQLKSINGMSERDLNIYVKRSPRDSFTRKYLINQADIDAMRESNMLVGIDSRFRSVKCESCHNEIGGYLDYTNFFSFLSGSKSSRQ